mmetsp:Transcript_13223/g.30932  ORF Transcript_13223/g.30932 Transcript_13223/m.30932 type:complete len:207 (+) Transcript_13223:4163-4783(+)
MDCREFSSNKCRQIGSGYVRISQETVSLVVGSTRLSTILSGSAPRKVTSVSTPRIVSMTVVSGGTITNTPCLTCHPIPFVASGHTPRSPEQTTSIVGGRGDEAITGIPVSKLKVLPGVTWKTSSCDAARSATATASAAAARMLSSSRTGAYMYSVGSVPFNRSSIAKQISWSVRTSFHIRISAKYIGQKESLQGCTTPSDPGSSSR